MLCVPRREAPIGTTAPVPAGNYEKNRYHKGGTILPRGSPMLTPGRLASVLNGIVISTLSACGGASEGGVVASGGTSVGAGGETVRGGGTSNDSGSGGRLQQAGNNSGGSIVIEAGGSISTGGAGTAGNGAGGNVSMVSKPLCDEQGLLRFVEGLHLPEPVDYLGVYLNQGVGINTVYQATGTLCGGAGDNAACQAAFAAGAPSAGFPYQSLYPPVPSYVPPYVFMYVAYTRGDSVGFITDRTQLNALLGEIDTANEAGLVFLSMSVSPACNAIWETADTYDYSTPLLAMGCSFMGPIGHSFSVTHAGEVTSTQTLGMPMPCVGRRPVGLSSEPTAGLSPLGDYYASVAHLEGAAVLAFDVMERELKRFGAPRELQLRAQRARADEERHFSRMAAMARREGATVPSVRAVPVDERSLLAAALENAVEGCVREAWGALSAHYQAAAAADAEARQLWHDVARDESEHAELSLALHHWFMSQLTTDEQKLVDAAMQRARLELRTELLSGPAPHPAVAHHAGTPEPTRAAALFGELEQQVLETTLGFAA